MNPFIHRIATAVPPYAIPQAYARDTLKARLPDRLAQRLVHRLYSGSGIETRHSVVPDFAPSEGTARGGLFLDDRGEYTAPSTKIRNDLYTEAARPLFKQAAERVLAGSGFSPGDVTHVVTVSCTGFFAPGPDYFLVRSKFIFSELLTDSLSH